MLRSDPDNEPVDRGKWVLATIAVGGLDARPLVASLRSRGNWTGPIAVVGDNCTRETPSAFVLRVSHTPRNHIATMRIKMSLFELLEDLRPAAIVYIDADIVANRPLSPMLPTHFPSDCALMMTRERWYSSHVWNGGIFIAHRSKSRAFMAAWARQCDSLQHSWDQDALMAAVKAEGSTICTLPSLVNYASDFLTSATRQIHSNVLTHYTSRKREVQGLFGASNSRCPLPVDERAQRSRPSYMHLPLALLLGLAARRRWRSRVRGLLAAVGVLLSGQLSSQLDFGVGQAAVLLARHFVYEVDSRGVSGG